MLCVDPFSIVKQLTDGGGHTGLGPLDGRSLFHSAIGALRPAATALAELLSRGQLQLRMEWGDAHAVMEQLRMTDSTLLLDRIYLSNVPDYTSMLNAFLYFVPALRGGGDGLFEHELLLNRRFLGMENKTFRLGDRGVYFSCVFLLVTTSNN